MRCKEDLVNRQLFPQGPVGEHGGGLFIGTFERKRKCIFWFLFLGPRGHQKLSLVLHMELQQRTRLP